MDTKVLTIDEQETIRTALSTAMTAAEGAVRQMGLDAISSDYREEPGMIMPTIRIQNVTVAGAD